MTKGNYDVNNYNAGGHPPDDTSFRNCICAMLVFIGLCAVIAIVATVIHVDNSKKGDSSSADAIYGKGFKTITTPPPPRKTNPPYIPIATTPKRTKLPIHPTTTKPQKVTHLVDQDPRHQTTVLPLHTTESTQKVTPVTKFGEKDSESIPGGRNATNTAESRQPLVLWTEVTNKEEAEWSTKAAGDKDMFKTTVPPLSTTRSTEKIVIHTRFGEKESEVPEVNNVTGTTENKQTLALSTEASNKEEEEGDNKTVGDKGLSQTTVPTLSTTRSTEKVVIHTRFGENETEVINEEKNVTGQTESKQPVVPSTEATNKEEDEGYDKTVGDKGLPQTTVPPLSTTRSTEKVVIHTRFGENETEVINEEKNVTGQTESKQPVVPSTEATNKEEDEGYDKTVGDKGLPQTTVPPLSTTRSTEKVVIHTRFGEKESEVIPEGNNVTRTTENKQTLVLSTEASNKEDNEGDNKTVGDKSLLQTTLSPLNKTASTEKAVTVEKKSETTTEVKNVAKTPHNKQPGGTGRGETPSENYAYSTEDDKESTTTTDYGASETDTTEETIAKSPHNKQPLLWIGGTGSGEATSEKYAYSTEDDTESTTTTDYGVSESDTTQQTIAKTPYNKQPLLWIGGTGSGEATSENYAYSTEDDTESTTTTDYGASETDTTEETTTEWLTLSTTIEQGSSSPFTVTTEDYNTHLSISTTEEVGSTEGLTWSSQFSTDETTEVAGTTQNIAVLLGRNQINGRNLTEKKRSDEEDEEETEDFTEPDLVVTGEWSGDPIDPVVTENVAECKPKACAATVSRMFGFMDLSAEPCDDFYAYSCGGSSEDHSREGYLNGVRDQFFDVLEGKNPNGLPNYVRNFRAFYNSCVQHEVVFLYGNRIETVRQIVKNVTDVVLDNSVNIDKSSLTKLLAKLVLTKSFPLLKADIAIKEDALEYVLKLTLPDHNLKSDGVLSDWPTWLADERFCYNSVEPQSSAKTIDLSDLYTSYTKCRHAFKRYATAVVNVLKEIGFFDNLPSYNASQKINECLFSLEVVVMQQLEKVGAGEIRRREIQQEYEDVLIEDIQKTCDVIDWALFYEELTGISSSPYTTIRIFFYDKLKRIMKDLGSIESSSLYNILLAIYATDIYQNTVLPKQVQDRRQYCVELSTHLFHDVSTHLYLTSSSLSEFRKQDKIIRDMFYLLKDHLTEGFTAASWLEDEDKRQLIDTVNRLDVALGSSPSDCIGRQGLTQKYEQIDKQMLIGENFVKNLLFMMEIRERDTLSLAGKMFDQLDVFCYFLHPFDTEPKSFGTEVIAVPYGVLQQIPADVPGYILVARLGIHLAQEIAAHFDPTTIKQQKLTNSLSDEFFESYNQLIDERIPIPRTRVVNQQSVEFLTTNLTIDKEISDRTALRLASDVFNKWQNNLDLPWIQKNFTREQIFFITVAQEFCRKTDVVEYMLNVYENGVLPYPLRSEMMLVNSQKFTGAFDCRDGSRMKTEEVGKIQFPYMDEDFQTKRRRRRYTFDRHY